MLVLPKKTSHPLHTDSILEINRVTSRAEDYTGIHNINRVTQSKSPLQKPCHSLYPGHRKLLCHPVFRIHHRLIGDPHSRIHSRHLLLPASHTRSCLL